MLNRDNQIILTNSARSEAGVAMIEVLAALIIAAVMSLAVMKGHITALRTAKHTELNHAATSLAISKIELLSVIDPINLTSALNEVEQSVDWPGSNITFTRETTINVLGDGTRRITVAVATNDTAISTNVNLSTSFAPF